MERRRATGIGHITLEGESSELLKNICLDKHIELSDVEHENTYSIHVVWKKSRGSLLIISRTRYWKLVR